MKKRTIITILIVLVLLALTIFQLARNKKKINDANKPKTEFSEAIPVYSMEVGKIPIEQTLVRTGTLIPIKEADINAITGGRLVSINFQLGSHVSQGAVVAKIDNQQVLLNIRSIELQRDQAKRDYDRYKALYEGDAAPEINYQNAQLQYENLTNQISILQKQLSDFNIKAPISGVVITKLKEPGEFVGPGAVLGHIVDVSSLKAIVKVGEADIYNLNVGQVVKVKTDVLNDAVLDGTITFISSKGDATHNYDVEVSIKNNGKFPLKAGTFVSVDFSRQSSETVLAIPRSALVESSQNPYIYVVENNVVVSKPVVLGRTFGNNVEILDGLSAGQRVITSGLINLKPGMKVRPIEHTVNNNATTTAQP